MAAESLDFILQASRWDLVIISVVLFTAFIFFVPFRRKSDWKAHGVYSGFIIALFAEMFGFPLTIYFISSYFGYVTFQNQFLGYMNFFGMPIGLVITFVGLSLVIAGWRMIHKNSSSSSSYDTPNHFVNNYIYSYVRHPQYLGFILITLGWLIHWPTVIIMIMWPILVFMYYKLARREEKQLEIKFGEKYLRYKRKVPMLVPKIFKKADKTYSSKY